MKDFRDLKVWRKAHDMVLATYNETAAFPRDETYGLRSQLRRACTSIPMNIAEGCGRQSDVELARFLHIAMGSASEFEYQVVLASDLGLVRKSAAHDLQSQVSEIKRMLATLIKKLRADSRKLTADS